MNAIAYYMVDRLGELKLIAQGVGWAGVFCLFIYFMNTNSSESPFISPIPRRIMLVILVCLVTYTILPDREGLNQIYLRSIR